MSTRILDSLGSLKSVKEERGGVAGSPAVQNADAPEAHHATSRGKITPPNLHPPAADRAPLPLQGTSKKLHPDFTQMTTYVRKATKKAAWRRFEDEGGVEISDLVEILLDRYAAGQLGNVLRG